MPMKPHRPEKKPAGQEGDRHERVLDAAVGQRGQDDHEDDEDDATTLYWRNR
jgi:hypothetical protein